MACQPAHIHCAGVSEFPASPFHCVTGGMIRKCPNDCTQTCCPVNSVRWSKVHLLCPWRALSLMMTAVLSAPSSHLTLLSFLTQPITSLTSRPHVWKVKAEWTESLFFFYDHGGTIYFSEVQCGHFSWPNQVFTTFFQATSWGSTFLSQLHPSSAVTSSPLRRWNATSLGIFS